MKLKLTSWKSRSRRSKPKTHVAVEVYAGHLREGMTGKRIPGGIIQVIFDGRTYEIEMDAEAHARLLDDMKKAAV